MNPFPPDTPGWITWEAWNRARLRGEAGHGPEPRPPGKKRKWGARTPGGARHQRPRQTAQKDHGPAPGGPPKVYRVRVMTGNRHRRG